MSLPSDVNADVDEAVRALDEAGDRGAKAVRHAAGRVAPGHVGFAAAVLVAFLGVTVLGPRLSEWRRPRRETVADRAGRAARQAARRARRRAAQAGDTAGRHLHRLGGGTMRPR